MRCVVFIVLFGSVAWRPNGKSEVMVLFSDLRLVHPFGYQVAQSTLRHHGQDSVGSTFVMKTTVNSVHIWSVDLVHVEDDAPGSSLFKSQYKRMLCFSG